MLCWAAVTHPNWSYKMEDRKQRDFHFQENMIFEIYSEHPKMEYTKHTKKTDSSVFRWEHCSAPLMSKTFKEQANTSGGLPIIKCISLLWTGREQLKANRHLAFIRLKGSVRRTASHFQDLIRKLHLNLRWSVLSPFELKRDIPVEHLNLSK